MALQVARSEEALLAQGAPVGSLSCVNALVAPQVSGIRECFATLEAFVWPLTAVDPQVAFKVSRSVEALGAL